MTKVVKFKSPKYEGEFALYKDDEIVAMGTIHEIAEQRGIKVESVQFYLTDAYKNRIIRQAKENPNSKLETRLVLVPLDGDDDEWD